MRLLSVLAVLLLAPLPARAQHCYPSYQYQSYGYGYNYYPSYYSPVYYSKVYYEYVPKAVKAYVSPDYYSSVNDFYQAQLIANAAAGKALEMSQLGQQLGELRQAIQQAGAPQTPGSLTPKVPQQPAQPANVQPPVQTPAPRQSLRAPAGAPAGLEPLVKASCIRCHNAERAEGNLDLSDLAAVPYAERRMAYASVHAGEMPQASKPLAPEQQALFRQWADLARTTARRRE